MLRSDGSSFNGIDLIWDMVRSDGSSFNGIDLIWDMVRSDGSSFNGSSSNITAGLIALNLIIQYI